ncbi:hypothetical protein O181_018440 [Austropuccinia psidii MF-1]|uniref:Retrotransposon gag domain-containing protein n=1 Tax=Austropuccinia psidii MF-1 TaxID=1389203 RepID=A0A9Q3C9V3_9BASI|nr:hypothetical protein [Austropuccinia psidii MF-1]
MKAPDSFDGTQAHKLRRLTPSFQSIFHNDPASFFSERKKVLYSTCFLTGISGKWIEPYLSNITNEDQSYLLNKWQFFETQFLTLFGDLNEFGKPSQDLDNLRMKESGRLSFYISYFRSTMSRIGNWGEREYIHVYTRGLTSRLLGQLASLPGNFDSLQELMDITLELYTRYLERKKEKGSQQEKKPPVTGSNSFRPPEDSSCKKPHHKNSKKQKNFQVPKDKPHASLSNEDNKLISSEKERSIKVFCTYCGAENPI